VDNTSGFFVWQVDIGLIGSEACQGGRLQYREVGL